VAERRQVFDIPPTEMEVTDHKMNSMSIFTPSGMNLHRVEQAAHNNALWCDAVCQAHDTPGVWQDGLWYNRQAVPRFYPNADTLRPNQGAALDAVLNQLPAHCAIKDSFRDLDLRHSGFQVAFEASWIWRPAIHPNHAATAFDARWGRVSDGEQLAQWEHIWAGWTADSTDMRPERVFLPGMLADQNIAFLVAWRDERICAGVIANLAAGVVGLSNLFVRDEDAAAVWAGAVTAIAALFPGLDLVGYESGEDLALAQSAGFEPIDMLRVWYR